MRFGSRTHITGVMPSYDTLTVLTAPAVTLIGSVAALIGVWLTQRNNRKTKLMELEHNRTLKLLDLREQTARTIRAEKREAYMELLRVYRVTVGYTIYMGQMSAVQNVAIEVDKLAETSQRFQALMSDLDLVASGVIHDLAQKLYLATTRCLDMMYREN